MPIDAEFAIVNMNTSLKTKHGIDKLELIVLVLSLTEGDDFEKSYELLKKGICDQIGRLMTNKEVLDMTTGCYNLVMSDPGTKQRREAINYLFEAEFLDAPQQGENHERA